MFFNADGSYSSGVDLLLMFSMELPCMEILIGSRDLLDGQLRHSALPYMSLTLRDARVW